MTKAKLKTAPKAPAKKSANQKTKSKVTSKPFYTWRAEYWTDGPARIGSDYFRTLEDMFKVIDPKTFIDKMIDSSSMPCKRIEITVVGNVGKRVNNQICSAFSLSIAAVGVSANNQISLFPFYSDESVLNACKPFDEELKKYKSHFRRLFRFNQPVVANT